MNKYCGNCGAELNEGQDVCLKCGKQLSKNTKPVSNGNGERKSKITSSTMVLRLWERKMPLSGKGSPVRLR